MLSSNLLQLPLLGELPPQRTQIRNNILTRLQDRLFRRATPIRRHSQLKLGEERMGYPISGELDVFVLVEALGNEVAEGVVFFVEGEDGCVGDSYEGGLVTGRISRMNKFGRTCIKFPFYLLLIGLKDELCESVRRIHPAACCSSSRATSAQ